jgi:hypothetical protein
VLVRDWHQRQVVERMTAVYARLLSGA